MNNILPVFVIIPLGAAFTIPILAKIKEGYCRWLAVASGAALFLFSLASIHWLKGGVKLYYVGSWKPPFGICMVLDGLTVLMLLVVNLIGFLVLVYSLDYLKRFTSPYLYYTLFSLLLAGLNGIVVTGDLFNLFVFLEITSIASYALIAFGTEAEELEASFKYLVLGSVADTLILFAIGLLLGSVSTLNMADIARSLGAPSAQTTLVTYASCLFITGFGLKAALVPFHAWLPDAHPAAPAPMSAMLSGVVIKVVGVYALCRVIFNTIGLTGQVSSILTLLGMLSMAIGVILAIGQWDFKRLLAYHSISQIGYVVFGIGLGTPLGIAGGLFHLFNHSLFKSLLFLNSGAVEHATGTRRLDKLPGLSNDMPVTAGSSLVASLSIAGVPPLCGFWSKLMVIIAAFQAHHVAGAAVCIFTAMVTLASFLKVQRYAFLRKVEEGAGKLRESWFFMAASMAVLAILCVLVGVFFAPFVEMVIGPAVKVLLQGTGYANTVLGGLS